MDKSRRRRLSQDEIDNLVQQAAGRDLSHTAVDVSAPKPARHVAVPATAVAPRPTAAAREEAEPRSLQVAVTRLTERLATAERTIGEFQYQVDGIQTSLAEDHQDRKEHSKAVSEIKTLVEGLQNSSVEETVSNLTEHMTAVEGAIGGFEQLKEEQSKTISQIWATMEELRDTLPGLTERLAGVENSLGKFEQYGEAMGAALVASRQFNAERSKVIVSQIRDITRGLQNTLGYNIKRNFKCQSCSANGSVAIHVKCTECGKENWWGWPRKN